VERVLVRVMPPSSPPRSSRDFDVLRPPLLERAARIVARLQICAVDDRRRVVPMGASRARHVNGSRRRQGSTCFRSNDGSCSVRAVFGLPPRSDRGSRRADAVPIPTALSSRQDLTVIALFRFKLFRFKEYRRMRRQQGGREARRSGRGREPRGGGDQAQIPGWSSSWERCSSSTSCRPRALRARPSSRIACRAIELRTIPSCTRSNPEPRICTTSSATPRRTRSPRTPGCSPAARTVRSREIRQRIGRRHCRASMEIRSRVPPRTALKSAERPADEPSGQA
jgi:hypothetical protein